MNDSLTTTFTPTDLATAAEPYELLAEVLAAGPVLRSENSWVVSGHAECLAVLRHPQARSGFIGDLYREVLPPGAARDEMSRRINFLDPPDHGRVRVLVSKAFTPKRTALLEPFVAEVSRELLGRIVNQGEVDLIASFSHQVPSLVISELLGVPAADRDLLTNLSDRVSSLLRLGSLDAQALAAALEAAEEMHAYLRGLFEERRRSPCDDLVSALLAAEEDGARLTEAEMLSLAATLYSAGHRTTRDLFSNGMAHLLADRQTWDEFLSGYIPATAVCEEFLRFETPTHYVARMVGEPVALGPVEIPAGEPIVLLLAAANRDPRAYPDPAAFRPRRWMQATAPAAPLSFAFGPHFCLGASLARMEVGVMVSVLREILPALELADCPLPWRHTGLFRGLDALNVCPRGRAEAARM